MLALVLSKKKKTASAAQTKIVPESEIVALKAAGQVWVNTDTGLFHSGGQWYGAPLLPLLRSSRR